MMKTKYLILKLIYWQISFEKYVPKHLIIKTFFCLKWILKNFSTILQSQFNHHTLPFTHLNLSVLCLPVKLKSLWSIFKKPAKKTISKLLLDFFQGLVWTRTDIWIVKDALLLSLLLQTGEREFLNMKYRLYITTSGLLLSLFKFKDVILIDPQYYA